jgi:DNA-binding CsgD family transcriptional regulator
LDAASWPLQSDVVLVGRDQNVSQVCRLLDDARQGRSGTLVVEGPSGIGKTALLDDAVANASDFRVLRARGFESESSLPFAGLYDLFCRTVETWGLLPEPQADALRGALALSAATEGDRLACAAGVLSLLGVLAEQRTTLVVVDDVQWLDEPTLETLLFAARRLKADRTAVLLACRTAPSRPEGVAGLPTLSLRELGVEETAQLVHAHCGWVPAAGVAARLHTQTGGNPLALLELAALLTQGQICGAKALPDPLPVPRTVEQMFAERLAALPEDSQHLVSLAAADFEGDMAVVDAAAAGVGIGDVAAALLPAEDAGLLAVTDGRVSFRHPLVRQVAYERLTPSDRRAVHHALAAANKGWGRDDQWAWHEAAAAVGADEAVASALEQAAGSARGRRGFASAAAALERAAVLSGPGSTRRRRLVAAADAARLAGRPAAALRLLGDAAEESDDPVRAGEVDAVRGRIELLHGRTGLAGELLRSAAVRLEASDPDRAARLFAESAFSSLLSGDVVASMEIARRTRESRPWRGTEADLIIDLILGTALFHVGRAAEGFRLLMRAAEAAEAGCGEADPQFLVFSGLAFTWVGEYRRARRLLDRVVGEARRASALGTLPSALYAAAYLDSRTGRLDAAAATAAECVTLSAANGDLLWRYLALGCLAFVAALRGDEKVCREYADEATALAATLEIHYTATVSDALGLLELGCGRPEDAVERLEPVNREGLSAAGPPVLGRPTGPDLVEAYLHAGLPVPPSVLAQLSSLPVDDEFPASAALTWRCRGMVESDDDTAATCFTSALRAHQRSDNPYQRARTLLCYGERLRRGGRRRESRSVLREALDLFARAGAAVWERRAREELEATGAVVHRGGPSPSEPLTSQEFRIASAVAGGATNREVAAALFLSPKTVEFHLARIYRKVGVRNRTQLAAAAGSLRVADTGPAAPGVGPAVGHP